MIHHAFLFVNWICAVSSLSTNFVKTLKKVCFLEVKFIKSIFLEEQKVDILFCNAGVMWLPKFELTEDGHETTIQANYLG